MSDQQKKIIRKFLSPNSNPTAKTFPELVDCVVWFRCGLAVALGCYLGYSQNNRGATNLLFVLNVIAFVPILYCKTFLGADQDSYGNKLLFSGIFQGVALSMLVWFYFFTDFQKDDELELVKAFSRSSATNIGIPPLAENEHQIQDDTEF